MSAAGGAAQRITPYDLIFGPDAFDESRFETLRGQVDVHGGADPTALLMLPAAGELLHELLPEPGRQQEPHREVVAHIGVLLFHAFRHWLHGCTVLMLAEQELRALLERAAPLGDWRLRTPAPAGYVQLPRNVLWARVEEGAPAEPADGFFWSAPAGDETRRGSRLDLLLCLGVRTGRPGLSLVDVSLESADPLQHWGDVAARPGGDDFANILPGGELQHYHGLTTQAEVLKLASRCFHHFDTQSVHDTDG